MFKNVTKKVLVLYFMVLIGAPVFAQNVFSPDRPGFCTGTHTVSPGTVYLEMGYEFSATSRAGAPSFHGFPISNIRYGITTNFEMNFMWDGFSYRSDSGGIDFEKGFALGGKYAITSHEQYNISAMAILFVNNLDNIVEFSPLLGLLWDYDIGDPMELYGVVHLLHTKNSNVSVEFAVGLAYSINPEIGVYGEYYNGLTFDPTNLGHGADIGLTYLLNSDTQLDLYFTTALEGNAYRSIGFGFSKRF